MGWTGPVTSSYLTVIDSNGYSGLCPYSFNSISTTPTVSIVPTFVGVCTVSPGPYALRCAGDSDASLTASVFGFCGTPTYLWSTGATTVSISGLAAGTFTAFVTDSISGTQVTASYTVAAPASYAATLTAANNYGCSATIQCSGGTGGLIFSISSSGGCTLASPAPILSWSGPTAINNNVYSPTGLQAGLYTATFRDSNGCPLVKTFTLTEPPALSISGVVNVNAIQITASGGCGSQTLTWSSTSGITPAVNNYNPTGLTAGTYTATVTDSNGCTASTTQIVTYVPISVSVDAVDKTCGHLTCDDAQDGAIITTVSGSKLGTLSYVWTSSPGATAIPAGTVNPAGLKAGTYSVSVSDSYTSGQSNFEVISGPADLAYSVAITTPNLCRRNLFWFIRCGSFFDCSFEWMWNCQCHLGFFPWNFH